MDNIIFFTTILVLVFSLLTSFLINKLIISYTQKRDYAKIERKYLTFHNTKKNIPILGGIGIIISIIMSFIIYTLIFSFDSIVFISLISMILFALVGFIDDYKKIKKKNSDGLSPFIRLFLESIISIFILSTLGFNYKILESLNINGIKIGLFSFPLLIFLFLAGSNSSNFVDGLDGLDGGLTLIALIPNLFLAYKSESYIYFFFLISVIGSILGFLFLNSHPAKIFLGDTGSLSLGNVLIVSSIVLNNIILIPLIMLLFIIETLSIIIQVLYYKKTKKRIFLMAPLHHHFEMKNIEESKIVFSFYFIGFILSLIAILIGEIYGNINIR